MSLVSFNFAVFLGVALLVFHLAPARSRPGLLLGLSYAFYLTWSAVHALLLAAVTVGVYGTALWIERSRSEEGKRQWMAVGVMALVLLLFAFKSAAWWAGFFFPGVAISGGSAAALLIVPLGLSYYVFKMAGYLLDVYWETLPAQRSFVAVALYGSFFPQIVGGPIQRARSFFDQMDRIKNPNPGDFVAGLRRILFGLVKKVVIADSLAVLVENVFADPPAFSPLELLTGACCFAIQLYVDFSGITDIAIGVGLLFGVRGPENFDLPFYAPNIQQFWRRWHISLTTWLTDYLFTPVRMSLRRLATTGLCLAIFINMTAIGLWHGMNLKFLVFGMIHGTFVAASVLTLKRRDAFFRARPAMAAIRKVAGPLLTFLLVALSLVFFRAGSFASAVEFLAGLTPGLRHGIPALRFDLSRLGMPASTLALCILGFFATDAVVWAGRRRSWVETFLALPPFWRRAAYSALAGLVLLMFHDGVNFIYARF
jgi:D-alanyl-lipoteichoic acid acyltransferase DltB (MBOAT superfamily)